MMSVGVKDSTSETVDLSLFAIVSLYNIVVNLGNIRSFINT